MLKIIVPAVELYDENKDEFISSKEQVLQLEHSLVSISKWESKWCKPFLTKVTKTDVETIDYIRCMTLTQNVKPEVYSCLSTENITDVINYIEAPMTATVFSNTRNGAPSREIFTSEIIYYWMVYLNIPFECQKWHLNRLLTLINVCIIKSEPAKKISTRELMNRNSALNAQRRQALGTRG